MCKISSTLSVSTYPASPASYRNRASVCNQTCALREGDMPVGLALLGWHMSGGGSCRRWLVIGCGTLVLAWFMWRGCGICVGLSPADPGGPIFMFNKSTTASWPHCHATKWVRVGFVGTVHTAHDLGVWCLSAKHVTTSCLKVHLTGVLPPGSATSPTATTRQRIT